MDESRFDDLARMLGRGSSRRRALRVMAGGIAGLFAGSAIAHGASARTLTICHATGNVETPYESMAVSQAEFNFHARHGDILRVECCADNECANTYGDCGSGVCQNGYCVQLPSAGGTPCGDDVYCNGVSACDGAFNCVAGQPATCPESSNSCTSFVCDESAQGCIETVNEGASCTPDETHDGVCDAAGNCQPILICTPAQSCGDGDNYGDERICINGALFNACRSNDDCSADCAAYCECVGSLDDPEGPSYCSYYSVGDVVASSTADCPFGTFCNDLWGIGTSNGFSGYCTSPCSVRS